MWVPPDAEQVVTADYQLIAYPAYFQQPTQVAWSAASRPACQLVDEVLGQARAWGRDSVYWWVRPDTRPHDTEDVLLARGGSLAETVQVLAYDMTGGLPDLSLDSTAEAELVTDERTLRASHRVSAEVWDEHRERTPAVIAEELADAREAVRSEPTSGSWCSLTASRPLPEAAESWAWWPGSGAPEHCRDSAAAAPTGPCWRSACAWPAATAPRWRW